MRRVILWAVVAGCATVGAWAYRQEAEVKRGEKAFQEAQCGSCHLAGGAQPSRSASTSNLRVPRHVETHTS